MDFDRNLNSYIFFKYVLHARLAVAVRSISKIKFGNTDLKC